ncbi:glycosyltransferase family 8 protein [Anabaena subtropica]|uniref:Glycosyltransferase family 8 protein n=1 Tax=Anabaena subtropica FACHB-260 TaxID=2692884 RepID=A0ABR8CUU1_9NOST|nr:glycosyltransferase family 8 protein [Anabaena subtropica]MBD2346779.1 glycosyltransferase family 8 protein [Anabaena subtropica FACHB-260]
MDKSICLVCAADDNFSMPLAATTRSVVAHLTGKQHLALYIIDGGISRVNKNRIIQNLKSEQVSITWLKVRKSNLKNLQTSSSITVTAYYRILIPELLPATIEKAIYIDSDVIVRNSLQELWNIEIDDNYLLAIPDMGAPYVSSPRGLINYKELGINPDCKYFNSGVLVMNLKKWRKEATSQKIFEYLDKYKKYIRWHDQDAMNAILAGQWKTIDSRWNQMPYLFKYPSWQDSPFSEEEYNKLVHHPFIIHFSSRDKPWHDNCNHPEKHLFFEYLDSTIWSNWREEQVAKKQRQQKMAVFKKVYIAFKQRIKSLLRKI